METPCEYVGESFLYLVGSKYLGDRIIFWCWEEVQGLMCDGEHVRVWSQVFEHEYLHKLLEELGVSIDIHHRIMGWMIGPIVVGLI